MKKKENMVFIIICMVVCALPFLCMAVYRTDTTTENKTLATFPSVTKEGKINFDFFDELSEYFEDHFAFRQQLVTADALIQSKIFQVSNVDTVMTGTDGWLYYTDTLDDYLAQDTMNERQVFDTVNNLSLLQQYVTEQGAAFLFTVAPNKNSLYGDHMPYYASYKAGSVKNIDLLTPAFEEAGISYVDLFTPFEEQSQILYLKRDSHWNNEGAVLAYNTLMDALECEHETYETTTVLRKKEEYGDLNAMLYPLASQPEWNQYYQYDSTWTYTGTDSDVKAAYLTTSNETGSGSLLMFRDSFGNTLLPLFAEQYQAAVFSKSTPYRIAEYMEANTPDVVIAEKVERNLDEYMLEPPIMQGPECTQTECEETNVWQTEICAEESTDDTAYYLISGEITGDTLAVDAKIYIQVTKDDENTWYEAFTTSTDTSDYGYQLYLKKETLQNVGILDIADAELAVIVEQDGTFTRIQKEE